MHIRYQAFFDVRCLFFCKDSVIRGLTQTRLDFSPTNSNPGLVLIRVDRKASQVSVRGQQVPFDRINEARGYFMLRDAAIYISSLDVSDHRLHEAVRRFLVCLEA
jgi:hypothetical protein